MTSHTLSPIWGAGAQLFDNSGNVLTGGKIYTYFAGTTTSATTYTTPAGTVANSNPIIANAAGRLDNEIWFSLGNSYKFVLKDASDVLIATYDNIPTVPQPAIVNDASSISYESGYEVTAGNFTIGLTYLITSIGTTDFVSIGASENIVGILFTATGVGSGTGTAEYSRTVQDKLREIVSITDFGAIDDGITDCSDAIINALNSTTGTVYIPPGNYVANATTTNSSDVLSILNRVKADGYLIINLSSGEHTFTNEIVINSPDANKIQVIGATPITTTLSSQISATGAAKAYFINLQILSSSGVAVNDYVTIRQDVTGTGDFYSHAGIWKITDLNSGGSNRITVLNTNHQATFPTNTLTSGTAVILKTVCKFIGCDGFRFEGGQPLGILDNVAIVGDYDIFSGTGTQGAHGIVMATPNVITDPATSSNDPFNTAGEAELGKNVGVSAFGEQGIVGSIRTGLVGNSVASCSNRKRGIYSEGAAFRMKFSVASGNGEDGFIADTTGFIQAALSIASGNGNSGFITINNSCIAAASAVASSNIYQGFDARNFSFISADSSFAYKNTLNGFSAQIGGSIQANSATANQNLQNGFFASSGTSSITARNASAQTNTLYGARAQARAYINISGTGTVSGNVLADYKSETNSYLIETSAAITYSEYKVGSLSIYDPTNQYYTRLVTSGISDGILQLNSVNKIFFKADGSIYPAVDGTQSLGYLTKRWDIVYAVTGAINTSDKRQKQQVKDLSDAEHKVALKIKNSIKSFKFTKSVEEKGNNARIHIGVMAQDVKLAFEQEGLNANDYGLFCYDEWPEQPEIIEPVLDDDGIPTGEHRIVQQHQPAGNLYGIRYDELLAFVLAAL